jgi:ATP-binding cassette subfamily G (WHITE) protein 2
MDQMGLTHVKDVMVGTPTMKGISGTHWICVWLTKTGGERKRLCVAIELLPDPKLLFLDEPTSGLDSVSALNLVVMLKKLAKNGCTVICTIHQPQVSVPHVFVTTQNFSCGADFLLVTDL